MILESILLEIVRNDRKKTDIQHAVTCQRIGQRSSKYSHVGQVINAEETMLIPQLFGMAANRIRGLTVVPKTLVKILKGK